MRIADSMSSPPVCVRPETPLPEARDLMHAKGFRHLPVVDGTGRLLGVLSDRDVRSAFPSTVLEPLLQPDALAPLSRVLVGAVMSRPPVSLPREATLDDALLLFERHRVGSLPVADGHGVVVGIVTMRDVMRAYRRLFGIGVAGSSLVEILDDEQPGLLPRVTAALEERGIACTRIVRVERTASAPGFVSVRVQTYNAYAVHEALRAAGLQPRPRTPPVP